VVSGEVDAATAAMITDQVAAALDGAPSAVGVLMAGVVFIDSTGPAPASCGSFI
jgi:anti-anti-sigma regulatory factor